MTQYRWRSGNLDALQERSQSLPAEVDEQGTRTSRV